MNSNKKTGFVLAECLVAISSLATAAIVAGFITTNALSTTNLSKDYLIAQNLVTEGVEAVKALRNTNWLLYPNKKECWMTMVANCSSPKPADNSNYIFVLGGGVSQLLNSVINNSLNLDSSSNLNKTPYRLYIENSRYVGYPASPPGATASKYFRSIKFISIADTDADAVTDAATIEVKIQWKDGAKTREISKEVILYNYL